MPWTFALTVLRPYHEVNVHSSKVLLTGFGRYLRLCISGKHALGGLHHVALPNAFWLAWCPGHLYRQSEDHYDFQVIVQRVYVLT